MAQSPIVPKERLSAYQRWELGSFDAPPPPPVVTPVETERVRQIDERARAEGFRAGHAEGYEAGRREALAQGAPRVAALDALVSALEADLVRVDRELAHDVVELGLAVARRLVGAALEARPDYVCAAVEDALRHVVRAQGTVNVVVHPDDAAIVRSHLEVSPRAGNWALKEDAQLARGGCRIETGTGEVDATLEHRWTRIAAILGSARDWIESP